MCVRHEERTFGDHAVEVVLEAVAEVDERVVGPAEEPRVELVAPAQLLLPEQPALGRAPAVAAVALLDLAGEVVQVVVVVVVVAPVLVRVEVVAAVGRLQGQLPARLEGVDGAQAVGPGAQREGRQQVVRQVVVEPLLVVEVDVVLS